MQPSSAEPREEPSENAPLNRPGAARGELSALRHKQAPRTRGARACVICNKRKVSKIASGLLWRYQITRSGSLPPATTPRTPTLTKWS